MMHYLLQAVCFQLGFLLMYELLLKRETFFTLNRCYLLIIPVISHLLPLFKFESLASLLPAESVSALSQVWLPEVYIGTQHENLQQLPAISVGQEQGLKVNWWLVVYLGGVLLRLLLLLKKYQNLQRLFHFQIISEDKEVRIIEIPNSSMAFTFYKTVFLGDKISETQKQQILAHEMVHVKQKHSLDLLCFEILKVLFWFNPLMYIFQKRVATLHEFIADADVVTTGTKRSYYEQMLNTALNTQRISFINQFFNHSLIKKRIFMLQKSRSKTIAKFKYLLVLPLLFMMLIYVACSKDSSSTDSPQEVSLSQYNYTLDRDQGMTEDKKKIHQRYENFLIHNPNYVSWATIRGDKISYSVHSVKQEVPEAYTKVWVGDKYAMYINLPNSGDDKSTKFSDEMENNDGGVPFAEVDEVPVFEDCKGLTSNEQRKKCVTEKINRFVNTNFNIDLGKELKLKGVNRIITKFKIDEAGNIVNIKARAPHPELEREAIRVISELPRMKAGKDKGKNKSVMYSLPIVFKIGG